MITKEEIYKVIPKKILIEVIESFYLQLFNGVHGIDHWTRVLQNGIILCDKNPNLNKNIIIAFSFFHDVGRTREDDEPIHGYNGGRRLLKYKYKINLTKEEIDKCYEACVDHTHTRHHKDPQIAACWDADRLDLYRVGVMPDVDYLNLEESKEEDIIKEAATRSWDKRPDWVIDLIQDLELGYD